ncbi:MAG: serine/threonine protein kinase [Leptolyngbya sp.]|nr:serine/threonine protein kinase [Candidatus Melainabacteria bacterium]
MIDGLRLPMSAEPRLRARVSHADAQRLLGKTIGGKYTIQSIIGQGGMAVVYQAFDNLIERPVVIKVMQAWLASDERANERFKRECQLTAQLNHPNVIRVYDGGLLNNHEPFLVMEYVPGESLRRALDRHGPVPLKTAANIVIQVSRGLGEAHAAGIIHRDLKPDNILIEAVKHSNQRIKILDFGIAYLVAGAQRLTQTGKLIGTPAYISPEQLKDRAIDARADLYALGVILFELLTGRVPFEGETAESILTKQLFEAPPPISASRPEYAPDSQVELVILKALAKDPNDRYQTALEFEQAVEQAAKEPTHKRKTMS